MKLITKYFSLTDQQKQQFEALDALYRDWNSKINVISRKDIDNLYEHHVLHSLAIAELIRFKPGTNIMDLGTGGGFPGIPLQEDSCLRGGQQSARTAECHYTMVPSRGGEAAVPLHRVACRDAPTRPGENHTQGCQQRTVQRSAQRPHLSQGRRTGAGSSSVWQSRTNHLT